MNPLNPLNLLNLLNLVLLSTACGKSGPPLPPLVRVPVAPANITADRRGNDVELQFIVPDTNTDRTRPANIERVDVYAITGPSTMTDEQLLKRGTKVGSVDVKAPKDPNDTVNEDEPAEDAEPAVGKGLDQGAVAHVTETLTPTAKIYVAPTKDDKKKDAATTSGPLIGPPPELPARTYAAVGVSTRGKRGQWSKRVTAPLVDVPPPPGEPKLTYTEKEVTVTWTPVILRTETATEPVLPSRPLGMAAPSLGYTVYDVSTDAAQKITKAPVDGTKVTDARIAWGEKRCYVVRSALTVGGMTIESDPSPPACETLTDTFPPAAPKGLRSVAGEGSISLIWDTNAESDLAGYMVYRSTAGGPMEPVTPSPIQETSFTDKVAAGVRFVYAIKAVDKAGNASEYSERVEETAR